MSGYGVANTATSTKVTSPVPAIVRKCLWTGGIVRIMVPKNAKNSRYETHPCLVFSRSIRGNVINCHVHLSLVTGDLRGKYITAIVKVMEKTLVSSDEAYLYINLMPIASQTPPTHRLVVLPGHLSDFKLEPNWIVFDTPAPKHPGAVRAGVIVLCPPDTNVYPKRK